MPTSQHHHISLQQQYHHLRRDWDRYKTSIPHHRRSHSAADLPSSAAKLDTELLQSSPEKLVSSPQRTSQPGRRLLESFEKAKEAEIIETESLIHSCDCSSSSSVSLAWNEYGDDGSSSSENDNDGLGAKDGVEGKKRGWMERLRWVGIVMVAVGVGVFSFVFLFGKEGTGQLMTPT